MLSPIVLWPFGKLTRTFCTDLESSLIPRCVEVSWALEMAELDFVRGLCGENSHRKFHFQKFMTFVPLNLRMEEYVVIVCTLTLAILQCSLLVYQKPRVSFIYWILHMKRAEGRHKTEVHNVQNQKTEASLM